MKVYTPLLRSIPVVYFNFTKFMMMLVLVSGCNNNQMQSGTVTDVDGNVYNTVQIGNQVWMAENLRVTHYRNGDDIPNVQDTSQWKNLSTGAYCNYNNDTLVAETYGRLYNWYATNDTRNIAPEGWHIPDVDEIVKLMDHLNGDTIAGAKMKEKGTLHWLDTNKYATNESGFTALPGGYRFSSGTFHTFRSNGYWWSAGRSYELYSWSPRLYTYFADIDRDATNKNHGLSVRCVKD